MTTPSTRRVGPLAAAAGAIALLVGSMWVANQGAVVPDSGESAEKFIGTIYQGVRSLPILLAVWLGAMGIGLPLRMWLVPKAEHRIITQLCLGIGAMMMLDWLLAACGWLNSWTAWGTCGLGTAVITYHFADPATRDRWHPEDWPSPPWAILLALPALGMLLVACTMPPGVMWRVEALGYDVLSYHLQVPREWMLRGQMQSLPNNVYSHLPMLVESCFMKLSVMHGSIFNAVYSIQFFHASAAVLSAVAIGRLVSGWVGPLAGAVSGAAMLATPWMIITGSMAYSEMFVMLFGAAALVMVFDPLSHTPRGGLVVGLFAGLATMAKLTAGGMIAVPVGVVLLVRLFRDSSAQTKIIGTAPVGSNTGLATTSASSGQSKPFVRLSPLLMAILGGVLMLAPYFIRNTIWTGNPVFPFAARMIGASHWNEDQVTRWNNAHHSQGVLFGISELPRQWLLNTGYGALGGKQLSDADVTQVARFDTEYGFPLLWIIAAIGIVMMCRVKRMQLTAIALVMFLLMQLLFWVLFTHHQSRFLIPTLLPGCIFVGVMIGLTGQWAAGKRDWLVPMVSIGLLTCLTLTSFRTLLEQTPQGVDQDTKTKFNYPPYLLVDSMVDPIDVTANQPGRFAGNHPLNHLPATSRTMMVGDASQLLFIHRSILYNTAFDRSAFAELIRQQNGNIAAITVSLVRSGFTHVWINFGELERLANSYGVEDELEPARIAAMAQAAEKANLWRRVKDVGGQPVPPYVALYALPAIRPAANNPGGNTTTLETADE